MFSEVWIRFAAVMLLIGALLGQDALIVLASLLLTLIPVAWLWQRVAFWRVKYERVLSEKRVFQGEAIQISFRVANRKLLPLAWFRVIERIPLALAPLERKLAPSEVPLMGDLDLRASLHAHERARWDLTLQCDKRGIYRVGPARLRSGDLFGLFIREITAAPIERVIVYPRVRPLEDWGLPPKEPLGDALAKVRLFEDATRVRAIRDYRSDDSMKFIHWPASAHRGELQVKVNEPTIDYTWMLILNIATFEYTWSGIEPERAERAISLAASLANYGAEHKHAIGLLTNSAGPESDQPLRIMPGRGPNQLRAVLESLAACTYFVTQPIDRLLASAAPGLPWSAALVVITPLVTQGLIVEMERLARAGRKLALVSLDEAWERVELGGVVIRECFEETRRTDSKSVFSVRARELVAVSNTEL